MSADSEPRRLEAPFVHLEQAFIDEFVRAHGHDRQSLAALSTSARDKLLADASVYASGRLEEVEARSHFLHDIHDGGIGGHTSH